MNSIKVSIIIPVYNTERYLEQCLISVINQKLREIEIIIINDGSTDGSLGIIEEYALKDKRIRVINKENQGQGVARNMAIKMARGEYLGFVDSDDWVDPDMFGDLYNHAAKNSSADVVLCEFRLYNEQTGEYSSPSWAKIPFNSDYDGICFSYEKVKDYVFQINTGPFNKIFRTAFVNSINSTFSEGCYYEDIVFVLRAILNASEITYLKREYYSYRHRRIGSTSADSGAKHFDIFKVLNELRGKLNDDSVLINVEHQLNIYVFSTYMNHLFEVSLKNKFRFLRNIQDEFRKLDYLSKRKLIKSLQMIKAVVRFGALSVFISYIYQIQFLLFHRWFKARQ